MPVEAMGCMSCHAKTRRLASMPVEAVGTLGVCVPSYISPMCLKDRPQGLTGLYTLFQVSNNTSTSA